MLSSCQSQLSGSYTELNNIDLLFTLSSSPRIALLHVSVGYQGSFISICKNKLTVVVVVVVDVVVDVVVVKAYLGLNW